MKVYNLDEYKHGRDDVLVMGTDGLWDVTTDKEVADAVTAYLNCCDPSDPMRYAVSQIILFIRFLFWVYARGRAPCGLAIMFRRCVVQSLSTRWRQTNSCLVKLCLQDISSSVM